MDDEKQTCWAARMVYSLKCTLFSATYVGTTGLTAHRRSRDHQLALRRGDTGYAIVKHYNSMHPGQEATEKPFIFQILGAGHGGNLQRYVAESLHIKEANDAGEDLLNSKGVG